MPMVNIVSILLAGIANMGVGMLWYSPLLFGNHWMKLMGLTKQKMEKAKSKMGQTYLTSFLLALLQAYVIGLVLQLMGAMGYLEGMMVGFFAWLGFVMVTQATDFLFGGGKSFHLFLINTGYQLAGLLVMGAVMGIVGAY